MGTRPKSLKDATYGEYNNPDLFFIHEVVAGEGLLGLQGHQFVIVTDSHACLGSGLVLYTVGELTWQEYQYFTNTFKELMPLGN